jgi:hypothetical protein
MLPWNLAWNTRTQPGLGIGRLARNTLGLRLLRGGWVSSINGVDVNKDEIVRVGAEAGIAEAVTRRTNDILSGGETYSNCEPTWC